MEENQGYIYSIRGSVVEVVFEDKLPSINTKLLAGENKNIILEVASYVNDRIIRSIALTATGGVSRGDIVVDTGEPIMVPVGREVLGRMFDVFGNTLDGKDLEDVEKKSIHQRPLPLSSELSELQDRISSTDSGAITSIQAIYMFQQMILLTPVQPTHSPIFLHLSCFLEKELVKVCILP